MPALPGPASTVAPTSQPIGFDSTRGPLSGPRGWDSSTLGHPDVDAALHRSFLGTLPADVVERVMADRDLVDYPAGTTFYREGDPPRATLVVTGLIRVYLSSSEGRQVTVRYARSGEVLGIPLVVGGPLDVGAQTLAPSSLFNLNGRALVEFNNLMGVSGEQKMQMAVRVGRGPTPYDSYRRDEESLVR